MIDEPITNMGISKKEERYIGLKAPESISKNL